MPVQYGFLYLASGVVAVLRCEVERGGSQPVRCERRTARHEAAHSLRVAVPRSRQQLLPQLHQGGLNCKKKVSVIGDPCKQNSEVS
jgi:hypothetical protein